MINFFSSKPKLRLGDTYAVQTGDYAGQLFMFMSKHKTSYHFLAVPMMENREVPIEKFDLALESGIIEYVERAPRYVRNIARIQYEENSKV